MTRRNVMWLVLVLLAASFASTEPARAAYATQWSYPISPYARTGYGFGTVVGYKCPGVARHHAGIDLSASPWQIVRAAANGTVRAINAEPGIGYALLVEHWVPGEGTVITRYAGVSPAVGAGRIVGRGDVIGRIYNQGSNTHLHWSVWIGRYDKWAWRGYLPARSCGGDPGFRYRFVDPTRYVIIHSDVYPPATRVSLKQSIASHRQGWTRGSWTVTFRCTDDRSGCRGTQYMLDGGSITAVSGGTLTITGTGKHTLKYRSYDYRLNKEAWRGPVVLGIDKTAPAAQMQAPASTVFPSSETVELRATASDPLAGSPAGSSGIYTVVFWFCPATRASNADCNIVAGTRTTDGWVGRPSRTLASGAYEAWAVSEDQVIIYGRSASIAFTVGAPDPVEPVPSETPAA